MIRKKKKVKIEGDKKKRKKERKKEEKKERRKERKIIW